MNIKKIGFSNFSKHGLIRLQERTPFRSNELLELLDTCSFISLGVEVGFYKEHCLVYSSSNNEYFVAVQDQNTGTVVTVLTIAYHQTLSWKLKKQYDKIDHDILRRAKALASYNLHSEEMKANMSLKARYIDCDGKIRTTTIKKYKASAYSFQPSHLTAKEQKIKNLVSRWLKRMVIDEIIDIYVTIGRSGCPCFAPNELIETLNEKVVSLHSAM